ncbi:MAG: Mov34/MPN/PAD-1 family protein, partial [Candidatus Binatia bacterium]
GGVDARIRKRTLDEIDRHAAEAYPEECCGAVIVVDGEEQVRRITNVQNEYHARDPVQFPRDARTAYYMHPGELIALQGEAERPGRSIRLFYHSHPDHGAYFSAEDKAMAAPFGEPSYAEARYLVISVVTGQVAARLAVAWDGERGDYAEVPLRVEV